MVVFFLYPSTSYISPIPLYFTKILRQLQYAKILPTAILHQCESRNTTHCADKIGLPCSALLATAPFVRKAKLGTMIGAIRVTGSRHGRD